MFDEVGDIIEVVIAHGIEDSFADLIVLFEVVELLVLMLTFAV